MKTIKEAKEDLKANMDKGKVCPCCNQFVKMYKRRINSVMARTLIRLYHLPEGFNHVKEIVKGISATGTNDFSKLAYWNLIEEAPNTDKKKKTSGNWMITQDGKDFVNKQMVLMSYAKVYNRKCFGFQGKRIDISEALGNKFDYSELMKNI